jgi:hypothetical protein
MRASKNARLRMGEYGIVGQVINVPVDMNNMVTTPPRQLDEIIALTSI